MTTKKRQRQQERPSYWAVRPTGRLDAIRIEQATTARGAVVLAFGGPFTRIDAQLGRWEAKNLGTRVRVLHSDKRRIELLRDPEGWEKVK